MTFLDVLSQRHAVEQFDPTASITQSEIEILVQEASQAPSTFNLQHWRFVAILDPETRNQLSTTTIQPNRQRIVDASVIFVIFGDLEAHHSLADILEQSVKAGLLARETADLWVSTANQLYGADPHLAREETIRSVSLAAMVLMLAACDRGFTSCPIGFAPNLLQEILRTSDRYTPLMMIAVGRDATIDRKRRPRLPLSQILSFDAAAWAATPPSTGKAAIEQRIEDLKVPLAHPSGAGLPRLRRPGEERTRRKERT